MRWFKRDDLDDEASVDAEPRDERLRELVDALPASQQLAISLMYFGSGSPTLESVAADMGVSEYKVKTHIARGLENLGLALQAEND